ncbi:MAG: hypothetical protein MUE42_02195 [Opitutaceae bacterium]|nr:hypothetical protein [Opitutaceae bacterium]
MKKILWFALGLGLLAAFIAIASNTWHTAAYFQAHGRDGVVVIGAKYNTSLWSKPLPLGKIHSYVAVLAPDHELILETDRDLPQNGEHFVKFLLRDTAVTARDYSVRPLVNTLRLKSAADGTPVRLADTNLFDRIVDKAMGPPAAGVYVRPRETAEAAPTRTAPSVPFVFAGAKDDTWELVWNNLGFGECLLAAFWLLAIKVVLLHAWAIPFDPNRPVGAERKDFVHPSLKKIEPDATPAASTKLSYVPKPADHDYIQVGKPSPTAPLETTAAQAPDGATKSIALPPGARDPLAPPPSRPYSTATTAPFPTDDNTGVSPSLRLSRKPKPPAPSP